MHLSSDFGVGFSAGNSVVHSQVKSFSSAPQQLGRWWQLHCFVAVYMSSHSCVQVLVSVITPGCMFPLPVLCVRYACTSAELGLGDGRGFCWVSAHS